MSHSLLNVSKILLYLVLIWLIGYFGMIFFDDYKNNRFERIVDVCERLDLSQEKTDMCIEEFDDEFFRSE